MSLPHEVMRALRGHRAAKAQVLTWDGARPLWAAPSGLAIVSTTAPSSPPTGQLWYDPSASC